MRARDLIASEGEIMSEFDSDAADRLEEDPILGDPELDDPTAETSWMIPNSAAAEAEADQVDARLRHRR
jgi:hypothetical protein